MLEGQGAQFRGIGNEVIHMLYRERTNTLSLRRGIARLTGMLSGVNRRRRRVEMDLLALSPYLQRDIGFRCDEALVAQARRRADWLQ